MHLNLEPPRCREAPTPADTLPSETLRGPSQHQKAPLPSGSHLGRCAHTERGGPGGAVEAPAPAGRALSTRRPRGTVRRTLTLRPTSSAPEASAPSRRSGLLEEHESWGLSMNKTWTFAASRKLVLFPAILFHGSRLPWPLERSDTGPEEAENRLLPVQACARPRVTIRSRRINGNLQSQAADESKQGGYVRLIPRARPTPDPVLRERLGTGARSRRLGVFEHHCPGRAKAGAALSNCWKQLAIFLHFLICVFSLKDAKNDTAAPS